LLGAQTVLPVRDLTQLQARANRTAARRRTNGCAQQVGQSVQVVVKLIDIRPMLRDEFDGQRECPRRIDAVIAKRLIVDRASYEYSRL
jgi:hypothetical protein